MINTVYRIYASSTDTLTDNIIINISQSTDTNNDHIQKCTNYDIQYNSIIC